jgi:hypothetical protein
MVLSINVGDIRYVPLKLDTNHGKRYHKGGHPWLPLNAVSRSTFKAAREEPNDCITVGGRNFLQ